MKKMKKMKKMNNRLYRGEKLQRILEIQELINELENIAKGTNPEYRLDVWLAIARGKLQKIFQNHENIETLASGLEEYNPIVSESETEEGFVFWRLSQVIGENPHPEYETDDERVASIMDSRFIDTNKEYLLNCITQLTKSDDPMTGPIKVPTSFDFSFIEDRELRKILEERYDYAYLCNDLELYLLTDVMLGSIFEGILGYIYETLHDEDEKIKRNKLMQKKNNAFNFYIQNTKDIFAQAGVAWEDVDLKMLHDLKNRRNCIHPDREIKKIKKDTTGYWRLQKQYVNDAWNLLDKLDVRVKEVLKDNTRTLKNSK